MEQAIIERVKKVRANNKVSQIEFANSLGVSASYIAGLEMGRNSLNQKFLFAVKEKYDVSADWLMFGEESSIELETKLKMSVALDNANNCMFFAIQSIIKWFKHRTGPDDSIINKTLNSEKFKNQYDLALDLSQKKGDYYASILGHTLSKNKTYADISDEIICYSEATMKLNTCLRDLILDSGFNLQTNSVRDN